MFTCNHENWTVKETIIEKGRTVLRECTQCGYHLFGRPQLPQTNDLELVVASYKHKGKTFAQIKEEDPEYLKWLATTSKASDRIKKAAARVYLNQPFQVPTHGEVYPQSRVYDPVKDHELIHSLSQR